MLISMKNICLPILLVAMSFLMACTDEQVAETDDLLSRQIAFSEDKVPVEYYNLPAQTQTYIETEYFETYIESVSSVSGKGFEVILGTEDVIYANKDGKVLKPQNSPFSHGPCGKGKNLQSGNLPGIVIQQIEKMFPGANIVGAKFLESTLGRLYYIKVDKSKSILLFKGDGLFLEATALFYHCSALGKQIDLIKVSNLLRTYIAKNFPNAEIKAAFQKNNGILVVGILTPDGRRIIGFSPSGEFLWVRP